MKVAELIDQLKIMPEDAEVKMLWDGAARSDVQTVWLSRGGYVVLGSYYEPTYHDEDRPSFAPTEKEDRYWSVTPKLTGVIE